MKLTPKQREAIDRAVGNLIDRWDVMPNDVQGYLEEQDSDFCEAVEGLRTALEESHGQ